MCVSVRLDGGSHIQALINIRIVSESAVSLSSPTGGGGSVCG